MALKSLLPVLPFESIYDFQYILLYSFYFTLYLLYDIPWNIKYQLSLDQFQIRPGKWSFNKWDARTTKDLFHTVHELAIGILYACWQP